MINSAKIKLNTYNNVTNSNERISYGQEVTQNKSKRIPSNNGRYALSFQRASAERLSRNGVGFQQRGGFRRYSAKGLAETIKSVRDKFIAGTLTCGADSQLRAPAIKRVHDNSEVHKRNSVRILREGI